MSNNELTQRKDVIETLLNGIIELHNRVLFLESKLGLRELTWDQRKRLNIDFEPVSLPDLIHILDISLSTGKRWVKSGKIIRVGIGKYRPSDDILATKSLSTDSGVISTPESPLDDIIKGISINDLT